MEEDTLLLIKPDAVQKRLIGTILNRVESAGFTITGLLMKRLTLKEAQEFYSVHKGKPFFEGLTEFMTTGPVVAVRLRKENAILDLRRLVGPTNASEAPKGTLRGDYGTDQRRNAVHASDSPASAAKEIAFFFE